MNLFTAFEVGSMSPYQQNAIQCNRKKLLSKTKYVTQEAEVITKSLKKIVSELHKNADDLLKSDDVVFASHFEELNYALEGVLEKLFAIQTTIDPYLQGNAVLSDVHDSSESYVSLESTHSSDMLCLAQRHMPTTLPNAKCLANLKAVPDHSVEFSPVIQIPCSDKTTYETNQSASSAFSNISSTMFGNVLEIQNSSKNGISNRRTQCLDIKTQLGLNKNKTILASRHPSLQGIASLNCGKDKAEISFSGGHLNQADSLIEVCEPNKRRYIPQPDVVLGSEIIAAITHFITPSDFWMQTENSTTRSLCPVSVLLETRSVDLFFKKNDFCLAPFNQIGHFYRARILNFSEPDKTNVQVFYVDHGSKGYTSISKLQLLPDELYTYPALAYHCFLHGVSPVRGIWNTEAIRQFEETYKYSIVQPYVYSKVGEKYSVGLSVTAKVLDGNYTYDMAQMLFEYNYVVFNNKKGSDVEATEVLETQPGILEKASNLLLSVENSIYDKQNNIGLSDSTNMIGIEGSLIPGNIVNKYETSEILTPEQLSLSECVSKDENNFNIEIAHMINERNSSGRYEIQTNNDEPKLQGQDGNVTLLQSVVCEHASSSLVRHLRKSTDFIGGQKSSDLASSMRNDYDWNLIVHVPKFHYTQGDKLIIMISSVVNPSDLYVNTGSLNIIDFDGLQDQLSSVYNSCSFSEYVLPESGLKPNIFCCCRYSVDNLWYRAKVLEVCHPNKKHTIQNNQDILYHVQYVDYGNTDFVSVQNIRPLMKTFAKYPAFSVRCSLVGMKPKLRECGNRNEVFSIEEDNCVWSREEIENFRSLLTLDKCYTAEVATSGLYSESCPIPIYLWDNDSVKDILINDLLVERGIADESEVSFPNVLTSENVDCDFSIDPMSEDYYSPFNSYGVNLDDAEVATVGYRSKDEKNVCKYFAQSGGCYKGDNCTYRHLQACNGQTQDRETIHFLGESILLPDILDYVLVSVSAMFNPGHFFLVFPYGHKPVNKLFRADVYEIGYKENEDLNVLMEHMREYYSKASFTEVTTLALACGDLVAAKSRIDGNWYRGRVIEIFDIAAPVQVFFVDFGSSEMVRRTNIQVLKPDYRHIPFQAVECRLDCINPLNTADKIKWSDESRSRFMELVEGKILFAHVTNKISSVLYVELLSTLETGICNINDCLVKSGCAQYTQQISLHHECGQENVNMYSRRTALLPA